MLCVVGKYKISQTCVTWGTPTPCGFLVKMGTRALKVALFCVPHFLFKAGQHCHPVMLVAATNPPNSGGSGCVLSVLASRRYTQPIL